MKTKVLNFGSLNMDHVYQVQHFVSPGETLSSKNYSIFAGQRTEPVHSPCKSRSKCVSCRCNWHGWTAIKKTVGRGWGRHFFLQIREELETGHAIIQVDETGQNCIILYGGANQSITGMQVDETLNHFEKGDIILLQNEINELKYIMEKAYQKGLRIFLNPSPCDEKIMELPLELVDTLLLNEVEGEQITGKKEQVLEALKDKFPEMHIILTLGSKGSVYADKENCVFCEAKKVNAVDTTAAGDTFTGYYIAAVSEGESVKAALELATKAAAVAVTRQGAVPSIPYRKQL